MNYRSSGSRVLITRVAHDRIFDTLRIENIGYISKQNLKIEINTKFQLSDREIADIEEQVRSLKELQETQDRLAFLSLPEIIERATRHLQNQTSTMERERGARQLLFASEELKRIGRRHVNDLTEQEET